MSIACGLEARSHPIHIGGYPLREWDNEDYVAPLRIRQRNRDDEVSSFLAQVAAEIPSEIAHHEESPYTDL
jgi:hypothetical protein